MFVWFINKINLNLNIWQTCCLLVESFSHATCSSQSLTAKSLTMVRFDYMSNCSSFSFCLSCIIQIINNKEWNVVFELKLNIRLHAFAYFSLSEISYFFLYNQSWFQTSSNTAISRKYFLYGIVLSILLYVIHQNSHWFNWWHCAVISAVASQQEGLRYDLSPKQGASFNAKIAKLLPPIIFCLVVLRNLMQLLYFQRS